MAINNDVPSLPIMPYNARIEFLIAVTVEGKKKEFARLVGKNPSSISQIAQGKYRLTTDSKERLAGMGVNLNWLEGGQGEPFTDFSIIQTPIKRIEYFIEYGCHILRYEQESIYQKNADQLNRQLQEKFTPLKPVHLPSDFDLRHFSDQGKYLYGKLLKQYRKEISNAWIVTGSGGPFVEKLMASSGAQVPSSEQHGAEGDETGEPPVDYAQTKLEPFCYVPRLEEALEKAESDGKRIEKTYELAFRKDWVSTKTRNPDKLALFSITDDSMQPTLLENDLVLVDSSDTELRNGKIFLIKADNQFIVKRIIAHPGNKFIGSSDNRLYPDWDLSKRDDTRIVGRLIWHGREM
jgi:phage repressor protein C with HTH and peptisase S24 domain